MNSLAKTIQIHNVYVSLYLKFNTSYLQHILTLSSHHLENIPR